jgi:hypothetical protein
MFDKEFTDQMAVETPTEQQPIEDVFENFSYNGNSNLIS